MIRGHKDREAQCLGKDTYKLEVFLSVSYSRSNEYSKKNSRIVE